MLVIISHHYVVNSGLTTLIGGHEYTFKDIYYLLFGFGGKIAINIFILITGYFMCTEYFIKKMTPFHSFDDVITLV